MKPYPKYEDSWIEWIGEVSEHWSALRLKWVCNFHYGESLSAQEREDGAISVYGSNGIVGRLQHDGKIPYKRYNEAPRSKLRGIKAKLRRSQTRLRSDELRRGSPCLSSLQQAAGYFGEGE